MESKHFIIGIDPGVSGGFCILEFCDGIKIVDIQKFSRPLKLPNCLHDCFCFIEQVHASKVMRTSRAFTFGENYGIWQGVMERAKPREIIFVPPNIWQKALGVLAHGDKSILTNKAKEMTNADKRITSATADAFLIAEYGRRTLFTKYL